MGTLLDRTDAQGVSRRVRLRRGGIDRRAAFRAEAVGTLAPTFRGLDVDLRVPLFITNVPGRLAMLVRNAVTVSFGIQCSD